MKNINSINSKSINSNTNNSKTINSNTNNSKSINSNSNKFSIYEVIKAKYHSSRSGDFLHYATFLPNSKDPDWREKGRFWNERIS